MHALCRVADLVRQQNSPNKGKTTATLAQYVNFWNRGSRTIRHPSPTTFQLLGSQTVIGYRCQDSCSKELLGTTHLLHSTKQNRGSPAFQSRQNYDMCACHSTTQSRHNAHSNILCRPRTPGRYHHNTLGYRNNRLGRQLITYYSPSLTAYISRLHLLL